jgi:GTP-binding protein LepA
LNRRTGPGFTDQSQIRNFCIIAHIDHGKSTVADRMLQLTGNIVSDREMRDRSSTAWTSSRSAASPSSPGRARALDRRRQEYTLGMIDTPGHVDFTYEVSRALAACEGAVLLVDATQGIEAQTLSNLYMAMEHDLTSSRC